MGDEAPNYKNGRRAFRGLALVFVLTFVNLVGLGLTVTALGGFTDWTWWQFIALFGFIETAAGLSNILVPNLWHLPVAEMNSRRTTVRLAGSVLLLPHWGGAARAAAGLCLLVAGSVKAGFSAESLLLVPAIVALTVLLIGLAAAIARLAVAYPQLDTVQFIVRWRGKESELSPLSLTASIQQFLLGVLTLPAIKLLQPGALFGPQIRPSQEAFAAVILLAVASVVATGLLWTGRIQWHAPREQQREAEQNA
jgi:hypothetical protein